MNHLGFSKKLKELRKSHNLTQDALAQKILVSRTLISKYENGSVIPTKDNLNRIADYFGVSVNELMTNEDGLALALQTHNSYRKFKILISIFFTLLSIVFIMLICLPVFEYGHYVDPSDKNSDYVYGMSSILNASLKYGNFFALFSLIFNFINLICSMFLLVDFNEKFDLAIKIITIFVFVINIALFIISFIYGINIINSDNFQMNNRL